MPFTKNAILIMSFDELRKVKLHVSKEQNKFAQGSERWNGAETLRMCVESREDELEKQFTSVAKKRGAEFRRCISCAKEKPLEDHPYGFRFRVGVTVTACMVSACKRCERNKNRKFHSNNLETRRVTASFHQNRRQELGKIDFTDQASLRKLQTDECAYCGAALNGGGELDHFIPVEHGGANTIDNRVFACTTCNRNKGKKMPEEFLQWRKILKLRIRSGGFYVPHVR